MTVLFKLECPNRPFIKSFLGSFKLHHFVNQPSSGAKSDNSITTCHIICSFIKKDTQGGYLEQGHKYTALKLQKHASMYICT